MQEKDDIERQKSINKKDGLIMERTTRIEDKGMIGKGIVKEMLEKIVSQNDNILKLANIETLHKKLDIERDIEKERHMARKEIEKESHNSDSLVKVVNKEEKDNSSKKSNNLEEEIDERLKSIERFMTYTQDNALAKLIKKIEILNSPLEKKEIERDEAVLDITEASDNEKNDKYTKNTICHKCKEYGHTKKQCDRHNKIFKQISKLEFEKDLINELIEIFNVNKKEIDQVKKKTKLRSTNPLKVNKR